MTKADLVKEVSRALKTTRKESEVIVSSIVETIVSALRSGEKIEIPGLGTFQAPQRKRRALDSRINSAAAPAEPDAASQRGLPNKSGLVPRADRVPFRYAIQLILENGRPRSVKTVNISQSGMLVESVLPIKTGSRVRIRTTELPFLCIGASIRRCARKWLVYRISLEFDSLLSRLF